MAGTSEGRTAGTGGLVSSPPDGDLASLISEHGPLSQHDSLTVAQAVATELAAAHEAGAVHGGLGPDLVLVDLASGQVRLEGLDGLPPGLSRASGADGCLAPEQVVGGEADFRSDLYALGCLLMLMLTGSTPAPVTREGGQASAVPQAGAPWPSDHRPDVDPALNGLVHDLLADSPARRPESADEVINRLARIEAELPGDVVPATLPTSDTRPLDTAADDLDRAADLDGGTVEYGENGEREDGEREDGEREAGEREAGETLEDGGHAQDGDREVGGARTEPIPVVMSGTEDPRAGGLALGTIPRTWLVGSAAAVLVVLAVLLATLLGGGPDQRLAASPAASIASQTSTPSASEATASPTTATATMSTTAATTATTATTTAPATATATTPAPSAPPTRARTATNAIPPAPPQQATLAGAIEALRATARGVVSSGAVDRRSAQELISRADDLATWLDRSRTQLGRKVADLQAYVDGLRRSGRITNDGHRQVSSALDQVRSKL